MSRTAILVGREVLPVYDMLIWAEQFENVSARRVGQDQVDSASVSTVFLGLDHSFGLGGPPQWFETMIFGGDHDGWQDRYATWDEAKAGHEHVVAALREGREP